MGKHATFVGADVHARSIFCRAVNVATGETWSKTFAGEGKVISLEEWVRSLPGPAIVGYESGCTGFDMARRLAADGIECEVIAVTTIPKSTKDKAHKCDKLDAAAIVREMANPMRGYSSVWVPSAEEEAARELARLKVRAAEEVKASKQRVACFLIKHGHAWNERTESGNLRKTWTAAYRTWLNSLRLDDPTSELVLNELVAAVDRRMVEDGRIRSLVEKEAEKPRWKPYVDALCRLSGIDEAKVAIASEMARWIWAVGCQVEREQGASADS